MKKMYHALLYGSLARLQQAREETDRKADVEKIEEAIKYVRSCLRGGP